MANTIGDVIVSSDDYVDINTLSGIAAGTAVIISNKSTYNIRLQIAVSKPDADSKDGEIIFVGPPSTSTRLVTAGESTLWAKSTGHVASPISMQDNS